MSADMTAAAAAPAMACQSVGLLLTTIDHILASFLLATLLFSSLYSVLAALLLLRILIFYQKWSENIFTSKYAELNITLEQTTGSVRGEKYWYPSSVSVLMTFSVTDSVNVL